MIRVDVKLMEVSVNLSLFPLNGDIYNFYRAVDFPPYMTTLIVKISINFDTQITNPTRLFSTNDSESHKYRVINTEAHILYTITNKYNHHINSTSHSASVH